MSIGGGDYCWFLTDSGYVWSGPGVPPGCGPGCCGGCGVRAKEAIENYNKFLRFSAPYNTTTTIEEFIASSNYVTKQELQEAINELKGVCGMSVDKESITKCNLPKGHNGFCYRRIEDDR